MANTTGNQTSVYYHTRAGLIASVVALSSVMLLAIIGNIVAIVIFRCYQQVRKHVTNHFLINLAISDLIVALVTMPFWVTYEIDRWKSLPSSWDRLHFEKAWNFIDILCEATSIANLTVVSIDRLYSVVNPIRHRTMVTPSLAHKIIFGTWAYAVLTGSIFFMETRWMTIIITVVAFLIPLVAITCCYVTIVISVRACRRRWRANRDCQLFGSVVNEYKTAKNLSVIILAFIACWTPFFTCSLILHYCHACVPEIKQRFYMSTTSKWLHYCNSALNPVLYTFFNPSYRVVFRRLYAQCLGKPVPGRSRRQGPWFVHPRYPSSLTSHQDASRTGSMTTRLSDTSSLQARPATHVLPTPERNWISLKQHLDIIADEANNREVIIANPVVSSASEENTTSSPLEENADTKL